MKKKGFTLIELLVVIAIIGILATIGLVALNGAREKARDATRKSDLSMLKTALILYSDDEDSTYPIPDSALTCASDTAGQALDGCVFNTTSGNNPVYDQYLSTALEDPVSGRTYNYTVCDSTGGVTMGGFLLHTELESPGSGGPYYWYVTGDGQSGDGETTNGTCG